MPSRRMTVLSSINPMAHLPFLAVLQKLIVVDPPLVAIAEIAVARDHRLSAARLRVVHDPRILDHVHKAETEDQKRSHREMYRGHDQDQDLIRIALRALLEQDLDLDHLNYKQI